MHVRVRIFGKPDTLVVVDSKLTKIENFRRIIRDKFDVEIPEQRLFYGGKLLEDGYTFHDYKIKLNDVIQLMVKIHQKAGTEVENTETHTLEEDVTKSDSKKVNYKDAKSLLYAIGDLIDMRDREQGAWYEGKIVGIVEDPETELPNSNCTPTNNTEICNIEQSCDSDTENRPPNNSSKNTEVHDAEQSCKNDIEIGLPTNTSSNTEMSDVEQNCVSDTKSKSPTNTSIEDIPSKFKKNGIAKYFSKILNKKQQEKSIGNGTNQIIKATDVNILYKIQLDADEEDSNIYCKLKEIRPRARVVININELKVGQKVMINYNTEESLEKGYWYDISVQEIKKLRKSHEIIGTVYLGPEAVPQNETVVKVHDKIFAIEEVIPLAERTDEYNKIMVTQPEKRSQPLNCLTCRDDEEAPCKNCGCYLCSGKEDPDKIVLCDECNNGYHMTCLKPPLLILPEEDWYCPSCKRDDKHVIAPGAAKQAKKASVSKSGRDWGRGMACVGKTRECAMPRNHFGPIPGIEVGMCWKYRMQLSESGVHRPLVSGIHGRAEDGAYSIVLSGGYEDDVDNGIEFTYTGCGGRDLSGNKRTAQQSCDQKLLRENKALARNCAAKKVSEDGGDAGDNWRCGKPVRVVRSYKMMKHFPKYAPKDGIRYDGLYKIVKYYPEKGLSGFFVWKYLLRRDDPSPAPWEPGAKKYNIVYPDGYLEAQAEKKAQKRVLRVSGHSSESESATGPSPKKRKTSKKGKTANKSAVVSPKAKIPSIFAAKNKTSTDTEHAEDAMDSTLSDEETAATEGEKQTENNKYNKRAKNRSLQECNRVTKLKAEAGRLGLNRKTASKVVPQSKKGKEHAEDDMDSKLSKEETAAIEADALNAKLWSECLVVCKSQGRKAFVEHVTQEFLCIICHNVTVNPVTTPCLHNFCMVCMKVAFKSSETQSCPCCRHDLSKYQLEYNEQLKTALQSIMAGYDAGKK